MTGPETLETLRDALRAFAAERDWDQFHSPKNLAIGVASEAGELAAEFQWIEGPASYHPEADHLDRIRHESADVLLYLVRLADRLQFDLVAAAEEKIPGAKLTARTLSAAARPSSNAPTSGA
jgi:NTP pyrophosphatase (non-canonical NTP hydrolase)